MTETEVLALERAGWQALSTDGATARRFYGAHLAHDVVMIFPGDMIVRGRDAVLGSIDETAWERYALSDEVVLDLGPGAAVVSYRVTAARSGQPEYRAICSTGYRLEGADWKVAFHQQTPL